MSKPLNDFFKGTVRRMVRSIGQNENGNIYPLLIGQVEKCLIEIVLEEQGFNYFHTARILGIGRSTLYRKMESLQIEGKKSAAAEAAKALPRPMRVIKQHQAQ